MLNKYDKKIILFPPGASGNFLSEFLTVGESFVIPQNRIDLGQRLSSAIFATDLDDIKFMVNDDNHQVVLSHYSNVSDLLEFQDQHWLRKIYPCTNLFGWATNVFYKKQQIEKVLYSQATMLKQFDAMFENLRDFYFKIKEDSDCPPELTLDFGKFSDINYLIDLYRDANQADPPEKKILFAQAYIDAQRPAINDCNCTDMLDIVNLIKPTDIYGVAILLFMYEKNNNTIDQNRNWTINDLPNTVDDAIEFLLTNSKNYNIF